MKKILLIDDDKAALRYYLLTLAERGFQVKHDRNPDDAWRSFHQDTFDLIILDSLMPPGKRYAERQTTQGLTTGAFIFQDIREHNKEVPILILTNNAGLDWIRDASSRTGVRVAKKIDIIPNELVRLIREMLED